MHLRSLCVRNFRNLASLDVDIPKQGVVILGGNGHGKTNLLEAIYYLVLFRSMRGAKDRELVRFGSDGFFVAGNTERRVTAGYVVAGGRKKVTVDGAETGKLADAVGTVAAVVLSPADRELVTSGPAGRRRYLDILLSLGSPGYLGSLTAMRGALRQRNAALRRGRRDEAQAFDGAFARSAAEVASRRRAWVETWRGRYAELARALCEDTEPELQYRTHNQRECDTTEEFERALAATLDRDLHRGMTTTGPHRDDLALTLGGHDLRRYGSAGEQRTAAVALRLLEAATLTEAFGSPPIALFDDVFAEFDADRQARLLALIQHDLPGQAIIAAPRESEVPEQLLDRSHWQMNRGHLAA